jgi:hypothetical protein
MSRIKGPVDLPIKHIDDKVLVRKLGPGAEWPYKETDSDVTLDVTLIGRTDNRAEDDTHDVNTFSTGLVISPPKGFHVQIVPHPSLHKHGYFLAQNPIVIHPENSSELIVPLFKFKEAEDLQLPFRAVQMITYETVYALVADATSARLRSSAMEMAPQYGYGMPTGNYGGYPPPNGRGGDMNGYAAQMKAYGGHSGRTEAASRPQGAPRQSHMF